MRTNKRLAQSLRKLGLARLVDSRRIRQLFGIPVWRHHLDQGTSEHETDALRADHEPRLSVVMPAYNVENYLQNTVETIQQQSYKSIQIVIVNDGSTDRTGEIADSIAKSDSRVQVLHIENSGPGAARNAGLRVADGEYLTFVDSDDELKPDAYRRMLSRLWKSGSDFVAAGYERFNSRHTWKPELVTRAYSRNRNRVSGDQHLDILLDMVVWNKIYRRKTWDDVVGMFPEGVLYEDQQPIVTLYASRNVTFDVMKDVVYRWRLRDDETSITQNKLNIENLQDRLGVAGTLETLLTQSANDALISAWYTKLLGHDLYWHFKEAPRALPEFRELLFTQAQAYYKNAPAESIQGITFDRRIVLYAAVFGNYDDFLTALMFFENRGARWRTVVEDGQCFGWVPFLEDLSFRLDKEALAVDPAEYRTRASITQQVLDANGGILVRGYLYPENIGNEYELALMPYLTDFSGNVRRDIRGKRIDSQLANRYSGDSVNDHSAHGFEVYITPQDVNEATESLQDPLAPIILQFDIEWCGFSWTKGAFSLAAAQVGHELYASYPDPHGLYVEVEHKNWHLQMRRKRAELVLAGVSLDSNQIDLVIERLPASLRTTAFALGTELTVTLADGEDRLSEGTLLKGADGGWEGHFLLPVGSGDYFDGVIQVEDRFGRGVAVAAMKDAFPSQGANGVHIYRDPLGSVGIKRGRICEVSKIKVDADLRQVRIQGLCMGQHGVAPSFKLSSKIRDLLPSQYRFEPGTGSFDIVFTLLEESRSGQHVVPTGEYQLGVVQPVLGGDSEGLTAIPVGQALSDIPCTFESDELRLELQHTLTGKGFQVVLRAPLTDSERTPYGQRHLAEKYFGALRPAVVPGTVLFECFYGDTVGDSPLAIDDHLRGADSDLTRIWSVIDHSVQVPQGARSVVRYTEAWYHALASSEYLINNNNFPFYFRKGEEQRYIQTWHGTPLKKIGRDIPATGLSLRYRVLMENEAQSWDVLLAQSPWAGRILRESFGFNGRTIVEGYPRNDALKGSGMQAARAEARRTLGLSPTQTAVLYAPTWRDNVKDSAGRYTLPDLLDFKLIEKEFSRGAVILHRAHSNTRKALRMQTANNVIDVSEWSDLNALILASDVLITDYSSIQFDYINTMKPILYLAPDMREYRDEVRGFYFDFEETAPGPILASTHEVVRELRRLPQLRAEYASRYLAFIDRFAPYDDGNSSLRVVEALLADNFAIQSQLEEIAEEGAAFGGSNPSELAIDER